MLNSANITVLSNYLLRLFYCRAPGEKLLLAIMNTARKNKLERFDSKLLCALHLLERYAAIEKLVNGMNRDKARNKFRNREYTYLPIDRVNLYEICENLGQRYKIFTIKIMKIVKKAISKESQIIFNYIHFCQRHIDFVGKTEN